MGQLYFDRIIERQDTAEREKMKIREIKRWLLSILVGTTAFLGVCALYQHHDTNSQLETNASPTVIDVYQQMQEEWKFDPQNPIDWRIKAMDEEEPFIGTGSPKK